MTPCPTRSRLHRFADGRLGPDDAAAVQSHLDACTTCPQYLDGLTGFEREPAAGDGPPAPPAVPGFVELVWVGRGGMGEVYRATQVEPRRFVALKMIRGGDGPEPRRRLRTEAEAIARLGHPHIVAIHLVGECAAGLFLALEHCAGGSLKDRLTGAPWPPRQAAELAATLAGAVHHAHTRDVVHRDLKPSNVLFTADGAAKVADFGLARLLDDTAGHTRTGDRLGTPTYMAPEQIDGGAAVGPAADVYALGALLYELLTGGPPFRGATDWQTLEAVKAREPVAIRALQPAVPRDLETVCLACLEKDPARRYPTAAALAEDLGRFLAGEPVRVRPAGWPRRGGRWVRRHPALTAGLLVAGLALVLGAVGLVFHMSRLEAANAELTAALSERDASNRSYRRAAYADACRRIEALLDRGDSAEAQRLLAEWAPLPGEEELRGWEWHYLSRRGHRGELARWDVGVMHSVVFRPDGRALAGAGKDRVLRVWDPDTGNELAPLRPHPGQVDQVVWAPDGSWLATACDDGVVRVWPAAGGPAVEFQGHTDKVKAIAVSGDGRALASASKDGTVRLWDPTDGANPGRVLDGRADSLHTVAFGPSGTVLSGGSDHRLLTWDLATGRARPPDTIRPFPVEVVRPIPGRAGFATGDRAVLLWEPGPRAGTWNTTPLPGVQEGVHDITFARDGRTLAVAGYSGVTVWRYWNGPLFLCRTYGHSGLVHAVDFHPDGRRLASAGADGTVRLWDIDVAAISNCGPLAANPLAVTHLRERLVCITSSLGAWCMQTWGNREGAPPFSRTDHSYQITGAAVTPDGTILTVNGVGVLCRVPPAGEPEVVGRLWGDSTGTVQRLAVSPDGRRIATVVGSDVVLAETASGRRLSALTGHRGPPGALVFSPDGRTLATAGLDRLAILWDVDAGKRRVILPEQHEPVHAVAFAPDGRTVATGGEDRLVRLWDATGRPLGAFAGHRGAVQGLAFSPDGRTLASVGADGTARLWQLSTGSELLTFVVADRPVTHVAFSPDGRHLTFAGPAGKAHPFPGGFIETRDCGHELTAPDSR